MQSFYTYVESVFSHWFGYMTGFGPWGIDALLNILWPQWKAFRQKVLPEKARRRIEVICILAGIFYSGFLAFKDEHAARLKAEAETKEVSQRLLAVSPSGLEQSLKQTQDALEQLQSAERERMKKKWRPLTDDEVTKWVAALEPYKNVEGVVYIFYADDNSYEFRETLSTVFQKVGWGCCASIAASDDVGVWLDGRRDDQAVSALLRLFTSIGYETGRRLRIDPGIVVRVGKKPMTVPEAGR